ncbi:RidA family protein [Horticoccus sp. 23ND18S-11]|uniref:RidA family protein n=1 Tax=Horticoccus sp. 23ND18S-11 TaxID=3391832 RepID=UPI0039C98FC0
MTLRRLASVFTLSLLSLAPLGAADASTPEAKLAALGLTLPATNAPIANYVPAVRTGNLVFLSGHIPRDAAGKVIAGKVGRDATEQEANAAARVTTLALLATLKKEIGDLSKVKRIVKVGGFVNAVDDFKAQPQVMNGCSDLLVAVFGDRGRHARAALGMGSLPVGAVVEIEMIVEVQ